MSSSESRVDVEVRVDGKLVELVGFVKDMMGGAIFGMVESLRGCENANEVEVRVRRKH